MAVVLPHHLPELIRAEGGLHPVHPGGGHVDGPPVPGRRVVEVEVPGAPPAGVVEPRARVGADEATDPRGPSSVSIPRARSFPRTTPSLEPHHHDALGRDDHPQRMAQDRHHGPGVQGTASCHPGRKDRVSGCTLA
jgi:hypothetical protein